MYINVVKKQPHARFMVREKMSTGTVVGFEECLNRDASGERCHVAIECHIVKIKKLLHLKFH